MWGFHLVRQVIVNATLPRCWLSHSFMKALLLDALTFSTMSSCGRPFLKNIDSSWQIKLSGSCLAKCCKTCWSAICQGQIVFLSIPNLIQVSCTFNLLPCQRIGAGLIDWHLDTFKTTALTTAVEGIIHFAKNKVSLMPT